MICKGPFSSNVLLVRDSCVGILGNDDFFSVTGLYDSWQVCILLMTKASLYFSASYEGNCTTEDQFSPLHSDSW